jgi:hypothetical protein
MKEVAGHARPRGEAMGFAKSLTDPTKTPTYADLRTALSTRVLPSDQIAPGTL